MNTYITQLLPFLSSHFLSPSLEKALAFWTITKITLLSNETFYESSTSNNTLEWLKSSNRKTKPVLLSLLILTVEKVHFIKTTVEKPIWYSSYLSPKEQLVPGGTLTTFYFSKALAIFQPNLNTDRMVATASLFHSNLVKLKRS